MYYYCTVSEAICNTKVLFIFFFNCIGLPNITTLNCNSQLTDGTCVINAKRGQSVTLCIGQSQIPLTIPQGKHVIGVDKSYWSKVLLNPLRFDLGFPIYRCRNGYCEEWTNNPNVNYSNFFNVSEFCLTVNDIGAAVSNYYYNLRVYFDARGAIQLPSKGEAFFVEYYEGNTHTA